MGEGTRLAPVSVLESGWFSQGAHKAASGIQSKTRQRWAGRRYRTTYRLGWAWSWRELPRRNAPPRWKSWGRIQYQIQLQGKMRPSGNIIGEKMNDHNIKNKNMVYQSGGLFPIIALQCSKHPCSMIARHDSAVRGRNIFLLLAGHFLDHTLAASKLWILEKQHSPHEHKENNCSCHQGSSTGRGQHTKHGKYWGRGGGEQRKGERREVEGGEREGERGGERFKLTQGTYTHTRLKTHQLWSWPYSVSVFLIQDRPRALWGTLVAWIHHHAPASTPSPPKDHPDKTRTHTVTHTHTVSLSHTHSLTHSLCKKLNMRKNLIAYFVRWVIAVKAHVHIAKLCMYICTHHTSTCHDVPSPHLCCIWLCLVWEFGW